MKKLIYLFVLFPKLVGAQLIYTFENDSLQNWIQVPENCWEIAGEKPLSGYHSLHHAFDNPDAGVDYIARAFDYPDLSDTLSFSFRVRHGYNPSSGNNWQLFILADSYLNLDKKNQTSGFFLGVNYNCSDDLIKLWQRRSGEIYELCSSSLNYQDSIGSSGEPMFKISRNPDGQWLVFASAEGMEESLNRIASGYEHSEIRGKYAGFRYSYSSAQDRKLWIDQFSIDGHFFRDSLPPLLISIQVEGLNSLLLEFSESIIFSESTSFFCASNTLDSAIILGNKMQLYYKEFFKNRSISSLYISGLKDLEGNFLSDTIAMFQQELSEFGDVVISEIMSDPEPAVYLPESEYLELYNRYDKPVKLAGWKLRVNGKNLYIENYLLGAGEYLLLTTSGMTCWSDYANHIELFTSQSTLSNSGGEISLLDPFGRLIHTVNYLQMKRYDQEKSEGGWSLERIDVNNLCGGIENWAVSIAAKGGTPGEKNSVIAVIPDDDPPELLYLGLSEDTIIELTFSEPLLLDKSAWKENLLGELQLLSGYNFDYNISNKLELQYSAGLKNDTLYQITLSDLSDCAGNNSGEILRVKFKCPVQPSLYLPVLNEVMYDPLDGGNEYIELFNAGDDFIDLKELRLGNLVFLSDESHLLAPGAYVVLCEDATALKDEWNLPVGMDVQEVEGWKALPNSGGSLELLDRSGKRIDRMYFADSLHSDLLNFSYGVALERISPKPCIQENHCWTSAAASSNYGTPGRENSQYNMEYNGFNKLKLTPEVFTPDNDGFEDILQISLPEITQNSLVDIYITDLQGNLIKELIVRGITGVADAFFWDGRDHEGRIVIPGIYIVHLRISNEAGFHIQRKACALSYR